MRITGLSFARRPRASRASKERVVPTLNAAPDLADAAGRRPAIAVRARGPAGIHSALPLVRRESAHDSRAAHRGGNPGLGREGARSSGSSKSLIPTARRRPMRCRCRSRSERRRMRSPRRRRRPSSPGLPATEEAILHDAIWDAAFREQLFRAHHAAPEPGGKIRRIARRAGQRACRRRRRSRPPRSSAPSKAIRRCSSRTNFS